MNPAGTTTGDTERVLGHELAAQLRAQADDDPPLTDDQLDGLQRLFTPATTTAARTAA